MYRGYWGYIGIYTGYIRDIYRVYIGVIWGLYRGQIGAIYVGIYRGYIKDILGIYERYTSDNGQENGNYKYEWHLY